MDGAPQTTGGPDLLETGIDCSSLLCLAGLQLAASPEAFSHTARKTYIACGETAERAPHKRCPASNKLSSSRRMEQQSAGFIPSVPFVQLLNRPRAPSATPLRLRRFPPRACASPPQRPPSPSEPPPSEPPPSEPPPPTSEAARILEQSWRFQHRNHAGSGGDEGQSRDCPACIGSGAKECGFCSGTGILTVGDKLLCSVSGGTSCPVCRGVGETRCESCNGSGQVAKWIV
jgi:hypothetical protein